MSSEEHPDEIFKVIIIGDSGVGKSCFLYNFTEGGFKEDHTVTIGVEYTTKIIHLREGVVKLQIWDTAGQERFRTITKNYYRGANAVVIVYDVTDKQSFEMVSSWVNEINSQVEEGSITALVANKVDMNNLRVVSEGEGKQLAQSYGFPYFEASAKSGEGVEEVFDFLVSKVYTYVQDEDSQKGRNSFSLSKLETKKKKKCCK